jgi:hypothetical protein
MIPFVMIELDRPRKLRFGMGATVEFEQITGRKIVTLKVSEISGELCSKLLYVMLKQDDPELTIDQSNKLVDEYAESMPYVITKVAEAVNIAYKVDGGEKNAKTAKQNS